MRQFYSLKKSCHFCKKRIEEIDYKDTQSLRRYLGIWAKIRPAKETGNCSRHQRLLTKAVKRARFMALLSFTER